MELFFLRIVIYDISFNRRAFCFSSYSKQIFFYLSIRFLFALNLLFLMFMLQPRILIKLDGVYLIQNLINIIINYFLK